MRKVALSTAVVLAFATLSFAQAHHARTFRGQIMDSMCASMGGHSPGGYQATHTHTPKDCTLACVKGGSTFVLYNAARKSTLKLDDQNKARPFAGESVRVIGTYDRATKTIHVEKIEAAS